MRFFMLPYQLITSYTAFSTFSFGFICFNPNAIRCFAHAFVKWAFHWTYYLPLNGIAIMVLITQLTNFYKIFANNHSHDKIQRFSFFTRWNRACGGIFVVTTDFILFCLPCLFPLFPLVFFFCSLWCDCFFHFSTVLFHYFLSWKKMQWIIQKVHHFRQNSISKKSIKLIELKKKDSNSFELRSK